MNICRTNFLHHNAKNCWTKPSLHLSVVNIYTIQSCNRSVLIIRLSNFSLFSVPVRCCHFSPPDLLRHNESNNCKARQLLPLTRIISFKLLHWWQPGFLWYAWTTTQCNKRHKVNAVLQTNRLSSFLIYWKIGKWIMRLAIMQFRALVHTHVRARSVWRYLFPFVRKHFT